MKSDTKKTLIKDMTTVAMFADILVLQEFLLSFIPNVQLSVLLILLYSKLLGFKRSSFVILIYVALDNILIGSFNPLLIVFQLIAWLLIVFLICYPFKKVENPVALSLVSVLMSLIYCWVMIIPGTIVFEISINEYFAADVLFELIMCASSMLSVLLLYKPLFNSLKKFFKPNQKVKNS